MAQPEPSRGSSDGPETGTPSGSSPLSRSFGRGVGGEGASAPPSLRAQQSESGKGAGGLGRKPVLPPPVHAASAILIDAISGQVLYERNADAQRPMASTTKIMTALLFCEHVPDGTLITASRHASETRESSLHLKTGEKLSANDLLHAILMRSANDGCVAAAEYVGGSEAAFVQMMNDRAAQIGATHTHFVNPHGLHDPLHYTTARDLALIARVAMQQPRLADVVKTQKFRLTTRSLDHDDVTMRNHSHFLGKFPGADGIKTGWTIPAGHCYVGSATQKGWRLISVVLKSPEYVADTQAIMKFGFDNFEPRVIAAAGAARGVCAVTNGSRESVPVVVQNAVQVVQRKGTALPVVESLTLPPTAAPVAAGQTLGSLTASVDGKPLCVSPLVAGDAVAPAPPAVQAVSKITGGRSWTLALLALTSLFAVCLVSLRYGTKRIILRIAALAKSARRRRRRVAAGLRSPDRRGPGLG